MGMHLCPVRALPPDPRFVEIAANYCLLLTGGLVNSPHMLNRCLEIGTLRLINDEKKAFPRKTVA